MKFRWPAGSDLIDGLSATKSVWKRLTTIDALSQQRHEYEERGAFLWEIFVRHVFAAASVSMHHFQRTRPLLERDRERENKSDRVCRGGKLKCWKIERRTGCAVLCVHDLVDENRCWCRTHYKFTTQEEIKVNAESGLQKSRFAFTHKRRRCLCKFDISFFEKVRSVQILTAQKQLFSFLK